jgi:type IV pilus assembly protein PilY1
MLHAINVANGSELFAFVPNSVFSNLSRLTDPNYSHRYYVDLTPSINDVYITPASGTNAGDLSWNTILVGGLAGGGKGYFALNVTDPDDLDTETEAAANVMWEFTEADDGGIGSSDLGYTFSQPLIAMSNAEDGSGNKRWVVIFGNGYNSTSTDGDAHLYVLFVEGGQDGVWTANSDFYKVNTGFGKAESSDGTTPNGIGGIRGVDTDENGTVDLVYAGDLQGNLYRFDLSSSTAGNWTNAPKILFRAKYSANSVFPRTTPQPITTRPIVVRHPSLGGFIVITATGSWMTTDDATSTDIQSMYGIWDDLSVNPEVTMNSTTNQLVEQVFTNQLNTEHGFTVRTLTNNAVNWQNTGPSASKVKGWYIDFDMPPAGGTGVEYPGERAVRNIQLRGGLLFVNTVIPRSTAACALGAGGYELGFDPITGGYGSKVIFDIDGNGTFDDGDNVNDSNLLSNIITGIRFDSDTPTDAAFIGSKRFTQAGSELVVRDTNTGDDPDTGRTSWREIKP